MSKNELYQKIIEQEIIQMISEFSGKRKIAPETTFGDAGLDSLDTINMGLQIEEKYNVNLEPLTKAFGHDDDLLAYNDFTPKNITNYIRIQKAA